MKISLLIKQIHFYKGTKIRGVACWNAHFCLHSQEVKNSVLWNRTEWHLCQGSNKLTFLHEVTWTAVSVPWILQFWWLWKHHCEEECSPFHFVTLKTKCQSKKSEPVRMLVAPWSSCLGGSERLHPGREKWDLIPDFCFRRIAHFLCSGEMSQWALAIHKAKNIPNFLSASMFAACIFWRDSVLFCIQVNLIHSSAEYHWGNMSSVLKK